MLATFQLVALSSDLMAAAIACVCVEWRKKKKDPLNVKEVSPQMHANAHKIISCCCFHFAFSCWMFYSCPGMLIKLMNGETGIELIMFYGSKRSVPLRRVFLPQLGKWLMVPGVCRAPVVDGDRYEAWERHPREFLFIGVTEPSLHWYHTASLTYSLSSASSSHILDFFHGSVKIFFLLRYFPWRPWITSKLLCCF